MPITRQIKRPMGLIAFALLVASGITTGETIKLVDFSSVYGLPYSVTVDGRKQRVDTEPVELEVSDKGDKLHHLIVKGKSRQASYWFDSESSAGISNGVTIAAKSDGFEIVEKDVNFVCPEYNTEKECLLYNREDIDKFCPCPNNSIRVYPKMSGDSICPLGGHCKKTVKNVFFKKGTENRLRFHLPPTDDSLELAGKAGKVYDFDGPLRMRYGNMHILVENLETKELWDINAYLRHSKSYEVSLGAKGVEKIKVIQSE